MAITGLPTIETIQDFNTDAKAFTEMMTSNADQTSQTDSQGKTKKTVKNFENIVDNANEFIESTSDTFETYNSGQTKKTVQGLINEAETRIDNAVIGAGWTSVGLWTSNPTLTETNQYVRDNSTGFDYAPLTLPYTVDSVTNPDPEVLVGTELKRVFEVNQESIRLSEERGLGLGSVLFVGDNGVNVENGDTVPIGTTHLSIIINGKVEDVAMSPIASGAVSLLTEYSAMIGGTTVYFNYAIPSALQYKQTENTPIENMISGLPQRAGVGDICSTGSGVWRAKVSPQNSLSDFEMLVPPSLYDYGATGDNSIKDTAAFVSALASGLPFEVPITDYSKPFIVTGNVALPRRSTVFGKSKSRALVGADDLMLKQSYVKFLDANSYFAGGTGENDRAFIDWKNITFVGNGGYDAKSGIAIGRITGETECAIGGDMYGCTFNGFNEAWINDWAYFLDLDEVHLANNNRGLTFRDWNSSSIKNLYGTNNTSYTADTSQGDPANSVFENVAINMLSDTKIGIRTGVGVRFAGQTYFESFGSVDVGNEDRVDIAIIAERFANRTIALENILFSVSTGANYCMSIGGDQNLGYVNKLGHIKNCQFPLKAIAPIGFGITPQFSGAASYPNTTISDVSDSNYGLSYDSLRDAPNSPYAKYPVKNITTSDIAAPVSVSTNVFNALDFVEADNSSPVKYNNRIGSIDANGNFTGARAGVYRVNCNVNVSTTAATARAVPELILRAYGIVIDQQFRTMGTDRVGANSDFDTINLSGIVRLTDGIALEVIHRSNGAVGTYSIDKATLTVEYLGVGL